MTDKEHLGPPPVEPMSDVAWARVERKLWSRIDSDAADAPPLASRRRWLWIAIPAVAAAAAVALLLGTGVLGTHEPAPVISAAETIESSRVVAGDAPSSISFGDAHIALAAQSALVMSREAGSPSVLLERGAATFAVAPRAGRPPFIVRAGDTVVRVVGTRFEVARTEERITVRVEHGLVDVQFRGTTRRVGAHQSWTSDHPETVALAETAPSEPAVATPPAAPAAPAAPPTTTTTTTTTTPTTATAPAGDTSVTRKLPSSATKASGTAPSSTGSAAGVLAPSSKDLDREKYDRLTSLEQRDPEAALLGYLDLSRGHSRWSAVALYAAGRLAADRHDRRAQTFLTIYLRRFPDGANAEDARNLLARLKGDAP
ncbi:MAG: anti-FecI sigma factor, FecR [Myxococcales bacterium]|nr:anti-FecI sigma factor, FecR [Myxococcales bacterium]